MTLNDQQHPIDDLRRELAQVEEKIAALKYRASQDGQMFSLIGNRLQGDNPEFVGTEKQSFNPKIAPVGKIVCIPSNLISNTEQITGELRETIEKRNRLQARLEQLPALRR
jgi:hypothetical protein